tara:strand:+ start:57 stop:767 length:711 start_codon:yes stop_codon:yes gene_type:complete
MVAGLLQGSKVAGKFKDFMPLLRSSATGGLFSGGLTALFTGNPLAGVAVGAADTLSSAALATGIGALGTRKVLGKNINFAGGKKYTFSDTDDLDPIKKQLANLGQVGTATRVGKSGQLNPEVMKTLSNYAQSKGYYAPSGPQMAGMYATSIAAPFVIEPMFYPKPQGAIVSQQLDQRLGMDALMRNMSGNPDNTEGSSTDPNLPDKLIRRSDTQYPEPGYASGTLYQLAGNPMRGM